MRNQEGKGIIELMMALVIFSVIAVGVFSFKDILVAEDGKEYNDPTRNTLTERKARDVAETIQDTINQSFDGQAPWSGTETDYNRAILLSGHSIEDFTITGSGVAVVVQAHSRVGTFTATCVVGITVIACY